MTEMFCLDDQIINEGVYEIGLNMILQPVSFFDRL